MGMSERIEIHPKGGNPDRRYYTQGNWFAKWDSNTARCTNEWDMMRKTWDSGFRNMPEVIGSESINGAVHTIVMERIVGKTLEEMTFDARSVRDVVRQLYDIAAELMRVGIIHGDINVSNVMVRENGELVLIDWEMARPMEPGQELYDMVAAPWGIVKTINMLKAVA